SLPLPTSSGCLPLGSSISCLAHSHCLGFQPLRCSTWLWMLQGSDGLAQAETLTAPEIARLPAPAPMSRQLGDDEIAVLIAAANEDTRLAVLGLLSGLSAEEVVAPSWGQVDLAGGRIQVAGAYGRTIAPAPAAIFGATNSRDPSPPSGEQPSNRSTKSIAL